MSRLLHLSASPRGAASESLAMAEAFLDAYLATHPGDTVDHYDLWDGTLPEFGPAAAAAKMTIFGGGEPAGEQAAAWAAARAVFAQFDSYDRYLFSVPMWNAGLPYILKQFIDVVSQPGMVFSFDPVEGYTGLLTGKRAAILYTGAVYGPGRGPAFGEDYQSPYLEYWLRWAGVTDLVTVSFRPNLATADADAGRRTAHAAARDAGKAF
ncbi:MAG: FMN-dependent NADH-azoreductase [Mycobacteriales bacterium]